MAIHQFTNQKVWPMNANMWGNKDTQFFYELSPDNILNCIQKLGADPTGRCLQLNSLENRVYEIELDPPLKHNGLELQHVVAKFYRPGRWSKEQILEEHKFLQDLEANEIPVIPPLKFDGESLLYDEETKLFFCLYPRKRGRTIGELSKEQLSQIGRMLARIHLIGQTRKASHRLKLDIETYGKNNLSTLLNTPHVPKEFLPALESSAQSLIQTMTPRFENIQFQRIHGDCHLGNLIWREDEGFTFVDFDDMVTGPCVQDMWLLIPSDGEEAQEKRNHFLEGYEMFKEFNYGELRIVEALRALRYIHYAAWIAKRYDDPAFQYAFPHFKSPEYWSVLIQDLRMQEYKMQEETTYY